MPYLLHPNRTKWLRLWNLWHSWTTSKWLRKAILDSGKNCGEDSRVCVGLGGRGGQWPDGTGGLGCILTGMGGHLRAVTWFGFYLGRAPWLIPWAEEGEGGSQETTDKTIIIVKDRSLMEGGLGRKPVHTITDSIREHTEEWVSRKPICAAPSSTYKWRLAECTITQRNLDAPSASLCSIYISLGQIMYF